MTLFQFTRHSNILAHLRFVISHAHASKKSLPYVYTSMILSKHSHCHDEFLNHTIMDNGQLKKMKKTDMK